MKTTYFAFAVADGMFPGTCLIRRQVITAAEAKRIVEAGVIPCVNPGHKATLDAMRSRFGIDVAVPATPPLIKLEQGDRLLVMSTRGLPRREVAREYTHEEIAAATFEFSLYTVLINCRWPALRARKDDAK